MTEVVIREYNPSMRGAWLAMRAALFDDEPIDLLEEEVRQIEKIGLLKNQPFRCVLAEMDDRLVGFAEATIRSSAEDCMTSPVVYLEGWFVESFARRLGVGQALVEAVARWGRGHGCCEMASDAELDNELSAIAHRAIGFEDAGVIRCFRRSIDKA